MEKKPFQKSTSEVRLYIDTSHPDWIKFFTEYVNKNVGRIKIKESMERVKNIP